jgi:Domain of unknown function (DUF4148)
MKTMLLSCALICAASYAAVANAQVVGQRTRAQVTQELTEMEQAGYDPGGNQLDYPANLEAARERLESERVARLSNDEQTASAAQRTPKSN